MKASHAAEGNLPGNAARPAGALPSGQTPPRYRALFFDDTHAESTHTMVGFEGATATAPVDIIAPARLEYRRAGNSSVDVLENSPVVVAT